MRVYPVPAKSPFLSSVSIPPLVVGYFVPVFASRITKKQISFVVDKVPIKAITSNISFKAIKIALILFTTLNIQKIASLSRQEPQPAGTAKWPMILRFGKILGTTSVVRSIENPRDVLQKIHRP